MDEHRTIPRRRIFKTGTIQFSGQVLECVVRNISASGAALDVLSPLWFPDRFTLVVASLGVNRRCDVVWRREKRIGVSFVEAGI